VRDLICSRPIDLRQPSATRRLYRHLAACGIAVVGGIDDRSCAIGFARSVMAIMPHRDADPDGATTIRRRRDVGNRAGFAGFGDDELRPHTEGTALPYPPRMLILVCHRRAERGGDTVLADGRDVYDEVARDEDMLMALSTVRSACFGAPPGHVGSVFAATTDGRVSIRLRLDDLVQFTPATARYAGRLRLIVERHTYVVRLAEGHGLVLLNDRWLHGRTRFVGDRTMFRILGDPLPRFALPPGFAPGVNSLQVSDHPATTDSF